MDESTKQLRDTVLACNRQFRTIIELSRLVFIKTAECITSVADEYPETCAAMARELGLELVDDIAQTRRELVATHQALLAMEQSFFARMPVGERAIEKTLTE